MFGIDKMVLKLGLVLAILTALVGAYQWHIHQVDEGGYNRAVAEYLIKENVASAKAEKASEGVIAALKAQLIASKKERDDNKNKAVILQRRLDDRPTLEVFHEISNTNSNGCTDLGSDYRMQLNKLIGSAPNIQ